MLKLPGSGNLSVSNGEPANTMPLGMEPIHNVPDLHAALVLFLLLRINYKIVFAAEHMWLLSPRHEMHCGPDGSSR